MPKKPRLSKQAKRELRRQQDEAGKARKSSKHNPSQEYTARCSRRPLEPSIRHSVNPCDIDQMTIRWCETCADREGKWSWGRQRDWSSEEWKDTICPFFDGLGQITWGELLGQTDNHGKKKNDLIEIWDFPEEPQLRWIELPNADQETVTKLRVTGRQRLFGIRFVNHFCLVWWDPEHGIYPVEKSHT